MCCENVCMVVVKPFGMRYSLGLLPLAVSGSNERKRRCPAAAEPKITSPSLHMRSGGRNATGRGSIFTLFMFRVMILSRPQCKFACHRPAFSASFPHCSPLSHLWGKHSCFWPSPTNHFKRISFLPDFSVPHFYDKEHCCDCCAQKEFLTD